MNYVQQGVHATARARFGELRLTTGVYSLPAAAPGLRTRTDVEAILENARQHAPSEVIVPYASRGRSLGAAILPLVRRVATLTTPVAHRPLVIADVEPEAFSTPSVARLSYQASKPGPAVSRLLQTGLRSDIAASRPAVHPEWRQIQRLYGLAPLVDFIAARQGAVQSDVLSVPTPIIRSDPATVDLAIELGRSMQTDARASGIFSMFGMSLLLHSEIFASPNGDGARAALVARARSFAADRLLSNIVLGLKIYDPQHALNDQSRGSSARANLSELVSEVQAGVAAAGGLLVCNDVHNWVLGLLDSGADVASFKVTGRQGIEFPVSTGARRGRRAAPYLMMARELVEVPESNVRARYAAPPGGSFPVPRCVRPEPYWLRSWSEQHYFAARVRAGVLVEVGEEYRDAGLDPKTPLRDAVVSALRDSRAPELADLCPSAW